jgi:hypothetical protein
LGFAGICVQSRAEPRRRREATHLFFKALPRKVRCYRAVDTTAGGDLEAKFDERDFLSLQPQPHVQVRDGKIP